MNIDNIASDFDLENHIINIDLIEKALSSINVKTSKFHKNREVEIIVKRYFQNKTYKSIADEYKVSISAIIQNERRGLNRMRYALDRLMRV